MTQVLIIFSLMKVYEGWATLDRNLHERRFLAYEIQISFTEELSSLRAFFAFGDVRLQGQILYWQNQMDALLKEAVESPVPRGMDPGMADSGRKMLGDIASWHDQLRTLFKQEIELKVQGRDDLWREMALNENMDLVNRILSALNLYVTHNDGMLEAGEKVRVQEQRIVLGHVFTLVGVSLGLALVFALVVTRRVAWPLRQISEAAREMTAGNFRILSGSFPDDELGELAHSFNEMSVALEERQAHILQRNRELTTLNRLTALLTTAVDVNQCADEIIQMIVEALPSSKVGFYAWEKETGGYFLSSHRGLPATFVEDVGKYIATPELLDQKVELAANNVLNSLEDVDNPQIRSLREERFSSAVIIPVGDSKDIRAILLVCARGMRYWPADQISLLTTVGRQLSLVCENLQLIRERMQSERLAAVGQAISDVGHTIKNLVGGLTASTFLMEEALKSNDVEKYPRLVKILKDVTDRISTFMQDLLSFSGTQELSLGPVHVEELLREVVQIHEDQAASLGIELKLECNGGIGSHRLDHRALVSALSNLVVNAMDAIKEKRHPDGRIVLTGILDESGKILISVRDNGGGIPAGHLERIWEAFYTTKGTKGTGLGLSLVRRTAEQHGGSIDVISSPEEGTEFRISIPASPVDIYGSSSR